MRWAEARAGTRPDKAATLGIENRTLVEFPVPMIKLSVDTKLKIDAEATIVIQAWSDQTLLSIPDALWTTKLAADEESDSKERYLGVWQPRVVSKSFAPGSVTPKTVKVAKGATLKAEGDDPVTISGIIASTNGVGTIDGFAFAESGTIDIPEVSRIGKGISIEADFRNCELPDASEWTLKLNGTVKPNASVAITPTGIKVAGTGLTVPIR